MAYTRANPLDLTSTGDNIDEGFDKVDKDLDDIFTNLNAHDHSIGKGGTLVASIISDFDTAVASNSAVATNTAKITCNSTNVNNAGAVMNTDTTTASMQFVVDEDDMSSDSDTKVPTQQSVKAYAMGVEDYELSLGRIMNPLLHLPLKNSLNMVCGTGSVTFTRASNATYIDRYGVVQDATVDEARFEKEGLLIEGASTNKCLQSEDLSNASWSKSNCSISTNAIDAPDGTTTADGIIANTSDTTHYIKQLVSSTETTITVSVFAKAGDNDFCRISGYFYDSSSNILGVTHVYFDLTDGSKKTVSNSDTTLDTYTVTSLADDWYRISITVSYTGATAIADVQILLLPASSDNDATFVGDGSTINTYFWGAQLEEMPFATSYIPTTTAAVTRAVDKCEVTYAGNVPYENSPTSERTYIIDANILGVNGTTSQRLLYLYNGGDAIDVNPAASSGFWRINGSAYIMPSLTPNNIYRCAMTNDSSGVRRMYMNADNKYENTSLITHSGGSGDHINLGSFNGGTSFLFGHISNFRIYDVALTEAEMRIA